MIQTSILRNLFSYAQRALTPSVYSAMLQSTIQKQTLSEIMHNLSLFENNLQLFDYDYYQRICFKLLDYQKKMSVSEIITVLKLGIKHNIKNQMIWKHLQAQLHRRLYNTMNPVFIKQKQQIQKGFQKVFEKLQAQSQDYFEVLTDKFVQQTQQSSKQKQIQHITTAQPPIIQISSVPQKMKKQEIVKLSFDLVQILIWYGCNNNNFIKLLLETQLHPTVFQKTPYALIRYAELLTYACQINMKQYQTNKNKYTARSLKGIYKIQGAYLPQYMKNLRQSLSNFNTEDIKYLTEVINSFPIKKRDHRKFMVDLISNQCKKRSRQLLQQQKGKLQQILAKDEKLILKFRQANNLIPEEPTSSNSKNQKQQQQKQNQKQA